jgi:nitrous oxidase accessory protein
MNRLAPFLMILLGTFAAPLAAKDVGLGQDLQTAIAGAHPGDVLTLAAGVHKGPILIDRALTLTGVGAVIDGQGQGTVVTITGDDVVLSGLTIRHSGRSSPDLDAGVKIVKGADRARITDNRFEDNLHGVDVHGGHDSLVARNVIVGLSLARMNDRGNGVYVWNAPGTVIEDNDISLGRDGIFSNTSRKGTYRNNLIHDLRFAVHYMYTNDSEVSGNVSLGNHLGYAIMFSDRVKLHDNMSLGDRDYGVMMNYSNGSDVVGNLVRGAKKCAFIYNAHKNLIWGNRFEGCAIGIHFTAGSERNAISENAFLGSRNQVKYVGTRMVEWSLEGRGNYWSDHPAFDLNGDGLADSVFRPNDLMDHILWSQPAAAALIGSPAVQLIRWSQENFPALLPGGVVDSHPLMAPRDILVTPEVAAMADERAARWSLDGVYEGDEDVNDLATH